jgi:hypothetical protein
MFLVVELKSLVAEKYKWYEAELLHMIILCEVKLNACLNISNLL